jgi:hypothetical protein
MFQCANIFNKKMYGREKRKEVRGQKSIYKTNRRNLNIGTPFRVISFRPVEPVGWWEGCLQADNIEGGNRFSRFPLFEMFST